MLHPCLTSSPLHQKKPTIAAMLSSACIAALVLVAGVHAQTASMEDGSGLHGRIGVGLVSAPRYEGSPRRRMLAGPDFSLSYRTREWGSFEAGQDGLVWQAVDSGPFTAGLALGIDPGRKTRDTAAGNPVPGDRRLAGMGDIHSSAEIGVSVGYGSFSVLARQSLGKRGYQGRQVDLRAEWPFQVHETLGIQLGTGLSWADDRYTQAYFGVTSAQASASGYRRYTAGAGLHKFDISLGATYALSDAWHLQTRLTWSRLLGDAAESPLVSRKTAAAATVGVVYAF